MTPERHQLNQQIIRLRRKIQTLKPRSEDYFIQTRMLRDLIIKRMRDTANHKRAA